MTPPQPATPTIYRTSPLVSLGILGLLTVLTLPLPFLQMWQQGPAGLPLTLGGMVLGFALLAGLTRQRVSLDEVGLRVSYAPWIPAFLAASWTMTWAEMTAIRSRPTGQGGRAHYFVTQEGRAYLVPMRIAGFRRFLGQVTDYTGLETTAIKPLAQPWMYAAVILCGLVMLPLDVWVIVQALQGAGGL